MSSEIKFWNLHEPEDQTQKFRINWDKTVDLEQIVCPVYPNHRRGGRRTRDLSAVLKKRQTFDIMWTWHNECLIQQRTLKAFQEQGFTGFYAKPVQARFKRPVPSEPPTFWELVVTGWAGLASPESGIRLDQTKSCSHFGSLPYTKATDYSRLIDDKTWDGSDFFMVWPLPKYIFVADRVREFIQKNDIRLTEFARPADLQPKTPVDKLLQVRFGPGPLSHCMPEERAPQLRDALGIY